MSRKGNGKKYAAVCLSGGILLAALAMSQNTQGIVEAAEKTQEETEVSLAIAGGQKQEAASAAQEDKEDGVRLSLAGMETEEETETETETEKETETEAVEQVTYETLETTATGDGGISAIDVSGIVENCMPSIVAITNKSVQEVENYFYGTMEFPSESAGSGIIIAQNATELMIATNKHVVEDAQEMTVCFTVDVENPEDLVVPAVTKGTDREFDLAVIAVKLSDIPEGVLSQLKIATLGSSDNLKVGETAIAIGNALGTGQTVTCGIISALEREITTEAGTFTELQTDAAINLGCSGGALLNKRGEVIGINSAKATADYAESMGYAIPIDTAIPVLSNLINRQTRETVENHGYIGITVVPVSDEAIQLYNMPAGAFVYDVTEGSAGDAAGLKQGDIITKFDGISIDSSDTLVETLAYYEVGETVTVEIQQAVDGAYVAKEVEVTLQQGISSADTESDKEKTDKKDRQETPNQEQAPDENQEERGNGNDIPQQFFDEDDFFGDYYGGENNDGFGSLYDFFF